MKEERCCIKGCRNIMALTYYGRPVCQAHFDQSCDGFIDLKSILGIKEKHTHAYTHDLGVYTHTHAKKEEGEALKLTNFC